MESWEALTVKGQEFLDQGDYSRAFKAFHQAINSDPRKLEGWVNWAKALRFLEVTQPDALLKKTLVDCLNKPIANHQDIAFAGISLIKLLPDMQILLGADLNFLEEQLLGGTAFDVLSDPLLLGLMQKTILADAALEKLLTLVRSLLLIHARTVDAERAFPFVSALALQCGLNEYVYAVTPDELSRVEDVLDPLTSFQRLIVSCYKPLQVPESMAMETIPFWGSIQDTVSQKVRAQYEENPYPRWTSLNPVKPISITAFFKQRFPHAAIDERAFPDQPHILIAGCGTGQHAFNTAHQFQNSQVLALDLSRASLSYATRKAREFNIQNIAFLQADILALESFPQRFDLIECTGVLHHMAQPAKGWRILKQLLQPHGIMHIGLYSEKGRQDVLAARRVIGQETDIRCCRQLLLGLPEGTMAKEVTHTIDFYTFSSCRDLLFHVQEQRFTLPQIAGILNDLELEFLGFDLRDPQIKKQYYALFPEDERMTSLGLWDQFETEFPGTFSGMYQFWVCNYLSKNKVKL